MAELIVITGGAFSGKTALVAELARRGHRALPEAALEVIAELTRELGVEGQARWRRENQVAFQRRVTRLQHERERAVRAGDDDGVTFCDRAVLDGLAYCRLAGVAWPPDLEALTNAARYPHVFVLETLTAFDERRATGRLDTRDDSVRVARLLEEVYRPRAEALTWIPERPVVERAEQVLDAMGR